MTTPEHQSPAPQPPVPEFQDRVHRSSAGIAGGVLLLALVGWLGIDAVITGEGRTPWLALAALLLLVPLIVAFTLRPAVFADGDRLRIRNPFRVIVLPWGQVAALRSGYSNEVVAASGTKYQLWALPVSLRARKKAARNDARAAAEGLPGRGGQNGRGGQGSGAGRAGGFGTGGGLSRGASAAGGPVRAETDRVMDDLRELREAREKAGTAQGEVTVRWAYEIAGPAVAGAVLLAILLAVG
ncbi:PH domain-containing protein [Streptomyces poonensis]|uniref:Membrane protein n=1 Tax=Streptomyces poonensis TaxID=68255 RepID=A0A918P8Z2_9ACTN|nr:PH domain-containing protein [Streptomyces poonensis]GGY91611.1 membrane protein [Streptomyces poonensis]GLJ87806.1 membrane protein [Streptomyces poonensis]